jgi:hypothetical protein
MNILKSKNKSVEYNNKSYSTPPPKIMTQEEKVKIIGEMKITTPLSPIGPDCYMSDEEHEECMIEEDPLEILNTTIALTEFTCPEKEKEIINTTIILTEFTCPEEEMEITKIFDNINVLEEPSSKRYKVATSGKMFMYQSGYNGIYESANGIKKMIDEIMLKNSIEDEFNITMLANDILHEGCEELTQKYFHLKKRKQFVPRKRKFILQK